MVLFPSLACARRGGRTVQNVHSRFSFREMRDSPGQFAKLQKFKLREPYWVGQQRQVN
jgi:hypothetical protein